MGFEVMFKSRHENESRIEDEIPVSVEKVNGKDTWNSVRNLSGYTILMD
jgi:hypothetical protein